MRNQRQIVDYALKRRSVLEQFRAGHVAKKDVCDADPYLLRAARFHGESTEHDCPVCLRARVDLVAWVFGEELGHASGSARKPDEVERMADVLGEFTVYVVEVCQGCRWNHLAISYTVGTGERVARRPARTRVRRSVAP